MLGIGTSSKRYRSNTRLGSCYGDGRPSGWRDKIYEWNHRELEGVWNEFLWDCSFLSCQAPFFKSSTQCLFLTTNRFICTASITSHCDSSRRQVMATFLPLVTWAEEYFYVKFLSLRQNFVEVYEFKPVEFERLITVTKLHRKCKDIPLPFSADWSRVEHVCLVPWDKNDGNVRGPGTSH